MGFMVGRQMGLKVGRQMGRQVHIVYMFCVLENVSPRGVTRADVLRPYGALQRISCPVCIWLPQRGNDISAGGETAGT